MRNLNKTVSYMLYVPVLFFTASCNFLNVEQTGKQDIPSFFSDALSLEVAVNGIYNLTYAYYDTYAILYPEVTGDLIRLSPTLTSWVEQFNFSSAETEETSPVGYIWKDGYEIINNANMIIYYGPNVRNKYPQQEERINNAIAQAYFLRGLIELNIVLAYSQSYGYTADASHLGVVVLERAPSLNDQLSRTSCFNTYQQILNDISTAKDLLSDSQADVHFATKAACDALLARVYLYMGDYSSAAAYAEDVISDYGLSLTPYGEYTDMFCSVAPDSPEEILRLDGTRLAVNLRAMFDYMTPAMYPSQKLLDIFEEDRDPSHPDIRESLLSYEIVSEDDPSEISRYEGVCMKYTVTEEGVADDNSHYDPFVLRLSEMYLIRAEANCALGNLDEAAEDIMDLQSRATGIAKEDIVLTYSDAAELDAIIQRERMKELFLEGHRLYDITRRKENLERDASCGSTVLTVEYPDDRFILPIPLVELDASTLMQPNPINATQR